MNAFKAERERQRAIREREATNGRTDFPMSELAGKPEHNPVVTYIVSWQGKKRRTGGWWCDRRTAERIRDEKIADGTFLGTHCGRISGVVSLSS